MRDILDFVTYLHTVTTYHVIAFFFQLEYLSILEGLSNKLNLVFTSEALYM